MLTQDSLLILRYAAGIRICLSMSFFNEMAMSITQVVIAITNRAVNLGETSACI